MPVNFSPVPALWLGAAALLGAGAGALLALLAVCRQQRKTAALTERHRTDALLRESEERFRLMVDGVVDYAICMLDRCGTVTSWNVGAKRIYGYQAEEIIGQHVSRLYPAGNEGDCNPMGELEAAATTGRFESEGWRARKDGTTFWANVVITALRDASGTLMGFSQVTRDLTERRRAEMELLNAKAAAERASKAKTEFLATMSHELRTPLNSLLILSRLLADNVGGTLTAKQVEYAKTIHSSGMDLLCLINDILDLARIESGAPTPLHFRVEPFSRLVQDLERTFRQVAEEKKLAFEIRIDPELPAAMRTDGQRVQQVVKNLLSNAFKFTRSGSVTLELAYARNGWTPGHGKLDSAHRVVAISVTDTGIGIPPEKQDLIFEAFQQADGGTSREFGGTGLGLSISRALTRLLGGELTLRSRPGEGSTFTLFLPMSPDVSGEEVPPGKQLAQAAS